MRGRHAGRYRSRRISRPEPPPYLGAAASLLRPGIRSPAKKVTTRYAPAKQDHLPHQLRIHENSIGTPPQNGPPARSCCVNATGMAVSAQMRVRNNEMLDEIFRAHYERVARAIGRVIHDQARAEEIAVGIFLKWWRNPQAQGGHPEGWLYRTARP